MKKLNVFLKEASKVGNGHFAVNLIQQHIII